MKARRNYITSVVLCVLFSVNVAYGANDGCFNISFNDNGYIVFDADYVVNQGSNLYVGLYNEDGVLIEVIKNKTEGMFDANTSESYTAAAYIWDDLISPLGLKQTVSKIKENSIYTTSTKNVEHSFSKFLISNGLLLTNEGEQILLPEKISLVDENADENTRKLYTYLCAVGNSTSVLFGHQNDITHKAGNELLSISDTYDIVGDYAAVCGIDSLSLTGDEFSAYVCNKRFATNFPQTIAGNVQATAYMTDIAIDNGAIITLSAHMPNFAKVRVVQTDGVESYARYNFSGYTTTDTDGDAANELLDGGKYNEMFCAYLDMIADYAKQVNGTIIFRPFHEADGSWFWWGINNCDDETYKEIYAYTVKYLRDEKQVHNFLYAYAPSDATKYFMRYPGDEYVDILGLDIYDRMPADISAWKESLKNQLEEVKDFSNKHNKIMALTETGVYHSTVEGDMQTAFLKNGNEDVEWFNNLWSTICEYPVAYAMVWSNFGETNGFYTPYVKKVNPNGTLYGHEMMDNFIKFYNNPRSIFASEQKECVDAILK